jgi:hypothetical protein
MIDKNLLQQLGWSIELINEVTRMSLRINKSIEKINKIKNPNISFNSYSGNSIKFKSVEINTGINLLYNKSKEL